MFGAYWISESRPTPGGAINLGLVESDIRSATVFPVRFGGNLRRHYVTQRQSFRYPMESSRAGLLSCDGALSVISELRPMWAGRSGRFRILLLLWGRFNVTLPASFGIARSECRQVSRVP